LFERWPAAKIDSQTNQTYYKLEFTAFRWTYFGYAFRLANTIIKDGISMLLLFIINALMMIQIRKMMSSKKKMIIMVENNLHKRKRVQIKMLIIVVISSSLNASAHLLSMVNYIIFLDKEVNRLSSLIENIFYLLIHLFSFFIFYSLNRSFSKIVNSFFKRLKIILKI
jgi:hypothetical protein